MDRLDRVRLLFGDDFEKIESAKVLLLGGGGVGSFALDGLYRSGVGDITVVDRDTFEVTNQNRQIGSEFVGEKKVEVFSRLYPSIKTIYQDVTVAWIEEFDFMAFDVVLDAIDDIYSKVALAKKCSSKLISSTGSARKGDFFKIKKDNIWKASGDRLASKFRRELKRKGFKGDFEVIYSNEEIRCVELGSFVGVTGAFGLALCSAAIQKILKDKS
ncbi:MAG: ThiF family adenylyltransferase [Campylobacterales bacterium]